MPSVSSPYFRKIKRTSHFGKWHTLSLEILWCVSYSHEWGVQRQLYFPRLLGPLGGVKRSNIILFQLQSQFQRFLCQTLCLLSQMKDTKHIRRDFNSVAWIMPKGSNFRALGCQGGSKKFRHCLVAYQIDGNDEQNKMQVKLSP